MKMSVKIYAVMAILVVVAIVVAVVGVTYQPVEKPMNRAGRFSILVAGRKET